MTSYVTRIDSESTAWNLDTKVGLIIHSSFEVSD